MFDTITYTHSHTHMYAICIVETFDLPWIGVDLFRRSIVLLFCFLVNFIHRKNETPVYWPKCSRIFQIKDLCFEKNEFSQSKVDSNNMLAQKLTQSKKQRKKILNTMIVLFYCVTDSVCIFGVNNWNKTTKICLEPPDELTINDWRLTNYSHLKWHRTIILYPRVLYVIH